jgi:hypothetical protein
MSHELKEFIITQRPTISVTIRHKIPGKEPIRYNVSELQFYCDSILKGKSEGTTKELFFSQVDSISTKINDYRTETKIIKGRLLGLGECEVEIKYSGPSHTVREL